jgi:hypothetical protein
MPRARYPATGTLTHESVFDVPWMSSTGGGWKRKPTTQELTTMRYKKGDISEELSVRDAEITVYHMWDESCVGLAANDPATRTLTFSSPTGHPPGAFKVSSYVLWNLREGLTAPGQWFHDRERGRIVYWPLPGQDIARETVIAATRETVLRFCGTDGNPITGVTLRGLTLSATTVPLRAAGFAADAFEGAVSLENATDCTLDHVVIARVAGHGVSAGRNCRGISVRSCEVSECGAGGIYVGGESARIEDNHVHDIGLSYPGAIGIYRGGHNGIVRHNEVNDTSYSGINYGGESNLVEGNLIHHCMKVLHDGAAIYLFAGKNCVIRGNIVRDIVDHGGYGASAFYLDERSENCVIEDNLAWHVAWIFQNHMARGNILRHNVAVVEGDAKLAFPKSSNYAVEGNIIAATGKIRIENPSAVTLWKNNLFFSGAAGIERMDLKPGTYLPGPVIAGAPEGSTVGDPRFVNAAAGDFGFRPGSPAVGLGLKPLDLRGSGCR